MLGKHGAVCVLVELPFFVKILKEYFCHFYFFYRKRYDRIEKEFIEAKVDLQVTIQ